MCHCVLQYIYSIALVYGLCIYNTVRLFFIYIVCVFVLLHIMHVCLFVVVCCANCTNMILTQNNDFINKL